MGCLLGTMMWPAVSLHGARRGKCKAVVMVDNTTDLTLDIWINGGGPIARLAPQTREEVVAPQHLAGVAQKWKATTQFVMPKVSTIRIVDDGPIALEIQSWELPPAGDAAARCDNGYHVIEVAHAHSAWSADLPIVVFTQRAFRTRHARRQEAKARAVAAARFQAARAIQTRVRGWLARKQVHCPICLDELPWPAVRAVATGTKCHRVCTVCASTYIDMSLREGRLFIRCPGGDCGALLGTADLKRLATPEAFAQYEDSLAAVHASRLLEESDEAFIGWCREHARQCPACTVVIWRWTGCDSMQCRCGKSFNWSSPEARITVGTAPGEHARD